MFIALFLMATFVAMIPFTYASAVDPTWLTGIYDDADYDEIVRLLTETSGVGTNPPHPAGESPTFITRIVVEGMNEPPRSAIPRSIQPRSPPTQTVSALLRLTRLISPSHSVAGASSVDSIGFAGALTRCGPGPNTENRMKTTGRLLLSALALVLTLLTPSAEVWAQQTGKVYRLAWVRLSGLAFILAGSAARYRRRWVMDNKTSATAFLLVGSVFTACAGATKPDVPDTETQRKVRTDLEQCNAAAGGKADLITVAPEGKYSFQVIGRSNVDTILTCMANKRYSGKRVNIDSAGYDHTRRYGGEGEPSR
jgi:hypothetical protein